MDIHGLQKLTLLDFPGRVACTVFLAGCGLRCPYCHNAELVGAAVPPLLDDGQLLAFLEKRRGLLDGGGAAAAFACRAASGGPAIFRASAGRCDSPFR